MNNIKKIKKGISRKLKKKASKLKTRATATFAKINFYEVEKQTKKFADHIESHFEEIAQILLEYESYEVVQDEVGRTLDVLRNLKENKKYFDIRIGAVTSFLPKNQPLYALTCFVIIPSLMAGEVHFRIPHSMKHFFQRLLRVLRFHYFFSNAVIFSGERREFLLERSALKMDLKAEETVPVTDVVIFTGQSHHADKLRVIFDNRTLFITNGSGHNPVVVSQDANIEDAVEATLSLQLYNQGQDCAAPNAILVHNKIYLPFIRALREELSKVRVGHYSDRGCRVGPISEPGDLIRIEEILVNNRQWIDISTPGAIYTGSSIVQPTIICKPLKEGGNFTEVFAPIIFVQKYEEDFDLSLYFEDPHYARNAMYVTLYGKSEFINNLVDRPIGGKVLHEKASIIRNTHLHAPGVERGTKPYGGAGYSASSLSINGQIYCKATLVQRDIYEWLVKPLKKKKFVDEQKRKIKSAKKTFYKDIGKLLGLKISETENKSMSVLTETTYVDSHAIKAEGKRYVKVTPRHTFSLLEKKNVEYISQLDPVAIKQIRELKDFLQKHTEAHADDFTKWLYSLPKNPDATDQQNKKRQLSFFKNVYQLLLGIDSGPRIAQFLLDADRHKVCDLLDL